MDCTLAPTMRAMIYNSITQNPHPTSMICNFGMCTMMGAIWFQSPHTKDFDTADPKGRSVQHLFGLPRPLLGRGHGRLQGGRIVHLSSTIQQSKRRHVSVTTSWGLNSIHSIWFLPEEHARTRTTALSTSLRYEANKVVPTQKTVSRLKSF